MARSRGCHSLFLLTLILGCFLSASKSDQFQQNFGVNEFDNEAFRTESSQTGSQFRDLQEQADLRAGIIENRALRRKSYYQPVRELQERADFNTESAQTGSHYRDLKEQADFNTEPQQTGSLYRDLKEQAGINTEPQHYRDLKEQADINTEPQHYRDLKEQADINTEPQHYRDLKEQADFNTEPQQTGSHYRGFSTQADFGSETPHPNSDYRGLQEQAAFASDSSYEKSSYREAEAEELGYRLAWKKGVKQALDALENMYINSTNCDKLKEKLNKGIEYVRKAIGAA